MNSEAPEQPAFQAARALLSDETDATMSEEARAYLVDLFRLVRLLPPPTRPLSLNETRSAQTGPDRTKSTRSPRDRGTRVRRIPVPLPAMIGLGTAIVFLAVLLFLPQHQLRPVDAIYLTGTGAARAARGVVLVDQDEMLVFTNGLSELERGYRYVVWAGVASDRQRLGSLVSLGDGRARLLAGLPDQIAAAPAELFEVTIEESTHTGPPSGPTVLAGFATGG